MKQSSLVRSRIIAQVSLCLAMICLATTASPLSYAESPKSRALHARFGIDNIDPRLVQALEYQRASSRADKPPVSVSRKLDQWQKHGVIVNLRVGSLTDNLVTSLQSLGAEVRFASRRYGAVTVRLPSAQDLPAVAALPGVDWVAPPEPRVRRVGEAESRAPTALRAEFARSDFNVNGRGQVLGIFSDSFARTAAMRDNNTTPAPGEPGNLQGAPSQGSGDLPASVQILEDDDADGTDEGAAMAELAFDMAPEVGFVFHDVGNSQAAFAAAIDRVCEGGLASIVLDDIGYLLEPYYQDGPVAQAASRCVELGIPFVSAVGNDGDKAYRVEYLDINPGTDDRPEPMDDGNGNQIIITSGDDLHDWNGNGDGFLAVTVPANSEVFVVLQWNQPHARVNPEKGSQIDLDLYATLKDEIAALDPRSDGFYAASIAEQGNTGQPLGDAAEFLTLQSGTSETTFYIAVEHYQGKQESIPQVESVPMEFRLVFIGGLKEGSEEYPFSGPSAWGHPLAEGVISVAAVPWWEAPDFVPEQTGDTGEIDPEFFTSRGGKIPVQFDAQGNFQSGVERFVPTLAGVDGNNTTFFGQNSEDIFPPGFFGEPDGHPNFFGTSAATPNVAGVLALMLEAFPAASPGNLVDALIATAIDVTGARANEGPDDVTGAGLVDAKAAMDFLRANPPQLPTTGSGGGGGGGGCFIATAAYGSYWAEEVRVLREFRDRVLRNSTPGRYLIKQYYRYSPSLADYIRERDSLRAVVRYSLAPVVWTIRHPMAATMGVLALLLTVLGVRLRSLARPPN